MKFSISSLVSTLDPYGSLGLIPGPIWKMSCNNLLLLSMLYHNMYITIIMMQMYKETESYRLQIVVYIHVISITYIDI